MSIPYTYNIIKVDPLFRVMEVVYESPGRQTMHIGARLPYQGETTESVVKMYAPVAYWREQEAAVVVPALGGGSVTPPGPQPLTVEDFDRALTDHLDATARAKRYDNRISCAVRAGYPGPFQAEGAAFAAWMDACNAQAYALLAEVQAGTRPLPSSTQALIDLLPPMVWPT